jgi:hypothetical protein
VNSTKRIVIVLGVLVMALVCGCARTPAIATDPTFARQLVDAFSAGSLSPLKDSLDPGSLRGHPDWVTAGISAVLRRKFGAVRSLKLESSGNASGPMSWTETIWTVTAERGSFQMQTTCTREGKVGGFWFRPSPANAWAGSMEMGVNYAKQKKMPPGW